MTQRPEKYQVKCPSHVERYWRVGNISLDLELFWTVVPDWSATSGERSGWSEPHLIQVQHPLVHIHVYFQHSWHCPFYKGQRGDVSRNTYISWKWILSSQWETWKISPKKLHDFPIKFLRISIRSKHISSGTQIFVQKYNNRKRSSFTFFWSIPCVPLSILTQLPVVPSYDEQLENFSTSAGEFILRSLYHEGMFSGLEWNRDWIFLFPFD